MGRWDDEELSVLICLVWRALQQFVTPTSTVLGPPTFGL